MAEVNGVKRGVENRGEYRERLVMETEGTWEVERIVDWDWGGIGRS